MLFIKTKSLFQKKFEYLLYILCIHSMTGHSPSPNSYLKEVTMKRLLCMLSLLLVCMGAIVTERDCASASTVPDSSYVEALLRNRIDTMKTNKAIVIGIIGNGEKNIYGYGSFDSVTGDTVDGSTVFEIGSITKIFTSLVLSDMAEHGEISTEDPISNYLPEGTDIPSRNNVDITLKHLSTHTSGLPLWPSNLTEDYTVEQMYDFLSGYRLPRISGEYFEYSNIGAGLLGHILSNVSGLESENLFVERICNKLNLDDTKIDIDEEQKSRFAKGHDLNGNPVDHSDVSGFLIRGAGALRSTAEDMLKFLEAQLGMVETDLDTAILNTHEVRSDIIPDTFGVGLGWMVQNNQTSEVFYHNGLTEGFCSFIGFDKNRNLGVVVLSNSSRDITDIGLHLLDDTYELYQKRETTTVEKSILKEYEGMYRSSPYSFCTVKVYNDYLLVQMTGEPQLPVYPVTDSTFYYDFFNGSLVFWRNVEGQGQGLTMFSNGIGCSMAKLTETDMEISGDILAGYAGRYQYEMIPGYIFTIREDGGKLKGHPPNSSDFLLHPVTESEFWMEKANAIVRFNAELSGTIDSMTLYVGGGYATMVKMEEVSVQKKYESKPDIILHHNKPNPFNPVTTISYSIPAGQSRHVTLSVYDIRGSLVSKLVDRHQSTGYYTALWNGTDDTGNTVSSGVYIYKLQAGSFTKVRKMMLVR